MRQGGGWFQTFLFFVKALYELKAGGLKCLLIALNLAYNKNKLRKIQTIDPEIAQF